MVYCDDPGGGVLKVFGDFTFDAQLVTARPGKCVLQLDSVGAQRREQLSGTLLDAKTGQRIPLGSYELRHLDGSGQLRKSKTAVIAAGTFTLEVFPDFEGSITFQAPSHESQTLSLADILARAAEGRLVVRL